MSHIILRLYAIFSLLLSFFILPSTILAEKQMDYTNIATFQSYTPPPPGIIIRNITLALLQIVVVSLFAFFVVYFIRHFRHFIGKKDTRTNLEDKRKCHHTRTFIIILLLFVFLVFIFGIINFIFSSNPFGCNALECM